MKKFMVVRGHAGSGKTTFAKEKIKEFKNEYPQAQIYHLENDMFLTDEAGVYTWSPKLLEDAKRKVAREIKQAYKFALENKDRDVLIVLSNVSARTKELLSLKEQPPKMDLFSNALECKISSLPSTASMKIR